MILGDFGERLSLADMPFQMFVSFEVDLLYRDRNDFATSVAACHENRKRQARRGDAKMNRRTRASAQLQSASRSSRRDFLHGTLTAAGVCVLADASLAAKERPAKDRSTSPRDGIIDAHVHVWTPDTRRYPLAKGYAKEKIAGIFFYLGNRLLQSSVTTATVNACGLAYYCLYLMTLLIIVKEC